MYIMYIMYIMPLLLGEIRRYTGGPITRAKMIADSKTHHQTLRLSDKLSGGKPYEDELESRQALRHCS